MKLRFRCKSREDLEIKSLKHRLRRGIERSVELENAEFADVRSPSSLSLRYDALSYVPVVRMRERKQLCRDDYRGRETCAAKAPAAVVTASITGLIHDALNAKTFDSDYTLRFQLLKISARHPEHLAINLRVMLP